MKTYALCLSFRSFPDTQRTEGGRQARRAGCIRAVRGRRIAGRQRESPYGLPESRNFVGGCAEKTAFCPPLPLSRQAASAARGQKQAARTWCGAANCGKTEEIAVWIAEKPDFCRRVRRKDSVLSSSPPVTTGGKRGARAACGRGAGKTSARGRSAGELRTAWTGRGAGKTSVRGRGGAACGRRGKRYGAKSRP